MCCTKGEAPVCFSKAVADFLTYDEVRSSVCVEDIPDLEIQDSLKKVIMKAIGMIYMKYH